MATQICEYFGSIIFLVSLTVHAEVSKLDKELPELFVIVYMNIILALIKSLFLSLCFTVHCGFIIH